MMPRIHGSENSVTSSKSDGGSERYPLLRKAIEEGRVGESAPPKREPRCGPWDEREDGAMVCRKCGDVDYPGATGPMGF
jgi:hypothetical protein